ncbi:hypothetical protein ACUXZZ_00675 [Streptomyces graminifolii]|uniref:hypothetical protein n=1 Tax=Streptomyces graminifolii TaxID=1266771 RepID=UPI004058314E
MPARPATVADIEPNVETSTTAFVPDPLWGPVFPDQRRRATQSSALWRLYVTSALPLPVDTGDARR